MLRWHSGCFCCCFIRIPLNSSDLYLALQLTQTSPSPCRSRLLMLRMLLMGEVRWCFLAPLVLLVFVSCDPSKAQGQGKNPFLIFLCLLLTILIASPHIQSFSSSRSCSVNPPPLLMFSSHQVSPYWPPPHHATSLLLFQLPCFYPFMSLCCLSLSLTLRLWSDPTRLIIILPLYHYTFSPWEHGTSCQSIILLLNVLCLRAPCCCNLLHNTSHFSVLRN